MLTMIPEPLITVIVPVYNTQKYLSTCVESIINQTYRNLQILLIDDGSSDCSPGICDAYADRDKRVSVIHKHNEGVSSARNLGIELANGEYISFIDSDDWLELDAYKHLVVCIQEYKVDAVIFEYFVDYENGNSVHKAYAGLNGLMNNAKAIETTISSVNRFAWSKLYCRRLIYGLRFEQSIHIGEDTLFACHALSKAQSVYYSAKPLYHHVQSDVSATRCVFNKKRFTGIVAYHRLLQLCETNYPNIKDIALSAYVSLIITTIIELCGTLNYPNSCKIINILNSKVRSYFFNVMRSDSIEFRVKLRFSLCCISPWLSYLMHKRHRITF